MAGSLHPISDSPSLLFIEAIRKNSTRQHTLQSFIVQMAEQDFENSFSYSDFLDAQLLPERDSFLLDVSSVGVPDGMAEFGPDQSEGEPEPCSISSAPNSLSSSVAQSVKYSSTDQTVADHHLNAKQAISSRVSSSPTQINHGQYLSTNPKRKGRTSPSGGRRGSTAPLAQNHTFSGITKAGTVHHTRSRSKHRTQDFRDQAEI